jgi:hypothetical protein
MFGKGKGEKKMNLQDVFNNNKSKLSKLAEKNTKRNEDGLTVVDKNDEWRTEDHHKIASLNLALNN